MDPHASLQVYKDLADHYERTGPPAMRDRFLVLAADAARSAGMDDEAERLRQHLLQLNPHHLLRPFRTFAQAMETPDVQTYVRDLRHSYPASRAESLLRDLRSGAPARLEGQAPPVVQPVYPVRDQGAPAATPAARPPARAEAAPVPAAARPPRPLRMPVDTAPASTAEAASGSWLPSLLFGVFLLLCVLLAVYTLGRPFLPSSWLP